MAAPCLFRKIASKRFCNLVGFVNRVADQFADILTHNVQRFGCGLCCQPFLVLICIVNNIKRMMKY